MKMTHERRTSIGGLIKFRFSVRYSRLRGWHLMELYTSHHFVMIEHGKRP